MGKEALEAFYNHRMKSIGLDVNKYPMPEIEEYGIQYLYAYTAMLAEREHYKKLNKKYDLLKILSYTSFILSFVSLSLIIISTIITTMNN